MKNSIFKNYTKKILKSEAFISVMIVFVLALGIIGTSFALYMDVDNDTEYQLYKVGDLAVSFNNGDNTINLENIVPMEDEYALASKDNLYSFYIYNTGTYLADYDIKLISDEGNEVDLQYINYQICANNSENCDEVRTLSDVKDLLIYSDQLSPKKENDVTNPSVYYFLRIWINNKYPKSEDSKTIKLKVVVEARNADGNLISNNTLAGALLSSNKTTIYNAIKKFDNESPAGLYKINDEEGIGYYYRGNVENNYVNLSGMCFRVVKIESDGSVKLVLENINGTCESNETNYSLTNDVYGYKEEEGKIKSDIEYTKNILKGFENRINDLNKLKKGSWCYNENAYLDESGNNKIENIYENSNVYYEGYVNLKNKTIRKTSCVNEIDGYVGMLTVEDAMMAGITESESESYLNGNYMLMSKSEYSENIDNIFVVEGNRIGTKKVNEVATYRPAIKVLKGTIITSGDGTKTNPYVIE